jgi:thiamine monophosphate synthase
MLQYIIDGSNANEIIATAFDALSHGCRWIRLNIDSMPKGQVANTIQTLLDECHAHEAFLSLENNVEAVSEYKIDGVHLNTMTALSPVEVRNTLGEEPFIGLAVKHAGDVPFVPRTAIDYISVENGDLDECRKIVEQMKASGWDEPVVATYTPTTHLSELFETGINGIVVHNNTISPNQLHDLIEEVTALVERRLANL